MDDERISVLLERTFGAPILAGRPTPDDLQAQRALLPARLFDLWSDHGFAGYGRGMYWNTDPAEYRTVLRAWERIPSASNVIGRDAFANLYILEEQDVYRFCPHTDDHDLLGPFDTFYEAFVTWSEGQRMHMWAPLFQAALAAHGELSADECYGFFPALALGGEMAPAFVQRVKIQEHLQFLAQLQGS